MGCLGLNVLLLVSCYPECYLYLHTGFSFFFFLGVRGGGGGRWVGWGERRGWLRMCLVSRWWQFGSVHRFRLQQHTHDKDMTFHIFNKQI